MNIVEEYEITDDTISPGVTLVVTEYSDGSFIIVEKE